MNPVIKLLIILLTAVYISSCEKKDEAALATLITENVTILSPNNVIVTGKVLDKGGGSTWEQGIMWWKKGTYWNTWPQEDYMQLSDPFKPDIEVQIHGLTSETDYLAWVYAENKKGISYGNKIEFITPELITGTFTDNRDGNIYKWVELGGQTWMAENMAFIPYVCPPDSQGGIWVYDYYDYYVLEAQQTEEYNTYGCLYDWETACDICPDGWHLPSDDEWKEFEMYLGMSEEEVNSLYTWYSRGGNVGDYIKIGRGCTNVTGFSALPGGIRGGNTSYIDEFVDVGRFTAFWTSTQYLPETAYNRQITWGLSGIMRTHRDMFDGYSVRCIKDEPD